MKSGSGSRAAFYVLREHQEHEGTSLKWHKSYGFRVLTVECENVKFNVSEELYIICINWQRRGKRAAFKNCLYIFC
jgi:hypothetical protein